MATSSSSSTSSSLGGATSSFVYDTSEEKTNGTRLARLLIDGGTDVLRKFLDSLHSPKELDNVLKKNKAKFQYLKSKRVIFDKQWEKLFPSSGDPPDLTTFDITLLHLLIREVCYLPAPLKGWHKMPAKDDESLQANITRIKCFRNQLAHSVSTGIPNDEFEDMWNTIVSSLEAIEISAYRQKIQGLKNDPIDHTTRQKVEDQVEQWRKLQQQDEFEPIFQLGSCLPDMLPQERMFGRSQELQQVTEYVKSGTFSVVLITGGPGFGKTTLAKAVAYHLAKPENGKTVLFCRLLSKKTFNDVATEMIHSCGKIHTQLPEHPDQWLKDWSKHIQKPVTFVLDNADGVLESEERTSFLGILSEMRKLSQKKVTFVITSRKQFKDPNLPSEDIRLAQLSSEQAQKVLVSRVSDEEIRKKLSKTKKIVELCGYVPLALCIVGSLLSDYTEEKLIECLEKEPMTVLDDDNQSVQSAIETSFDLLTKSKQDALILMSIFPGSFKCDAAEAIIKACSEPGTLPVSILRSLKNSSLVEQPSSRRYQLHPLIRAFAKKIDQANDSRLLVKGEKLACAHFMSRLDQNAKMYWSKDTCKASIVSFNEDRQNFQHFFQMYAKGMENHDQEIVEGCKAFQNDFLLTCMYLEKCIPPRFYTQTLEMLFKSFTEPEIQPVRTVELMCLRGHEKRKVGDRENYYQVDMEKAKQLYSKNRTEFATNAMSEVFLLNSYADSVSKRGDRANNKQVLDISGTALKLCDEKLETNHPERAQTLLFAGRFMKRIDGKRSEAYQKLQEALKLFQEGLGTHVSTVHALKEIGDFFFAEKKLEEALTHYEKALEMMKHLGMENNKATILILKNYGVCARKKGNYQEGKKYLERAYVVADRELLPDHMWKVMIKTQLALLHEKIGKKEYAKVLMTEGLEMCLRLKMPIKNLGNSYEVLEFLKRHQKVFPKSKFPR